MITSKDNEKLKLIRKLARAQAAASARACSSPRARIWSTRRRRPAGDARFLLRAGEDVEPALLDAVSTLGSGTRVIGVYRCVRGEPEGARVSLHGVADPGNVGTIVRTAHALLDSAVGLAPGCADPFGPKAVRASMGSIFAKPPIREPKAGSDPPWPLVGLVAHGGAAPDTEPVGCLCLGGERGGLPAEVAAACDRLWTIPLREGAESLNVAAAAAIALGRIDSAA